ncbi:hypothetical protein [Mycobacteroides abscessus]|uniref:hypothetical protein n=1 Tax=Mycobacteroides abscessus TaxID=36809 RepID=UPI0005E1E28B|nr:hypothetical protein [Mycobacteroides abscessus]ALM15258.1 hypothetical protein AOY11_02245 [Mycobacteroides abscessus]AMU49124.1 hypothetical protein A3O01_02330 [Mycobacteroides abscessus]ANO07795.1 hypothetical protein BAB76_02330 [Mycobacteroides abscessus]MDM3920807.1 hypothetical protein [Mycobacteroides abscessus]MDO2965353.1 hypothetical protein [Mycobacteroides abscessus subsp. abscessus]
MTVKGTLFLHQLDSARNATKWQCWGDTQTRLDLVYSEWVSFEEISEQPAFQRVKQIVNENRMYLLGPEHVDHSALLGGKGYHVVFVHPSFQGREIPPPMDQIPTS